MKFFVFTVFIGFIFAGLYMVSGEDNLVLSGPAPGGFPAFYYQRFANNRFGQAQIPGPQNDQPCYYNPAACK
ncbi:hypothetical protein CHUAL_010184 [Chamberlinius hualienensis]